MACYVGGRRCSREAGRREGEEGEEVGRVLDWGKWCRIVEAEGKEGFVRELKGLWWWWQVG